jgi:hypothetical protein
MANEGRVFVTIDSAGNAVLETKGVEGSSCTDFSKQLEKGLGTTGEITYTQEFYRKPKERAVVIRGME